VTAGLLESSDILPPLYALVLVWAEKVFMALAMIILVAFTIPDIRELASRVTSTLFSKASLELLKDPSEDDKGAAGPQTSVSNEKWFCAKNATAKVFTHL
jgi:hypothetical protein